MALEDIKQKALRGPLKGSHGLMGKALEPKPVWPRYVIPIISVISDSVMSLSLVYHIQFYQFPLGGFH